MPDYVLWRNPTMKTVFPTPNLPGSQEPTPAIKHKAIKFYFQKTPSIFSTYISLHPTQSTAKTSQREGKDPGRHITFCTVLRWGRGWGRGFPGTRDALWPFFFLKGKQNSVNSPGTGRGLPVLDHARRLCAGSGATLPHTQRLLKLQHRGFSWGLTWTPWRSCMGSFPWSRKALYLCYEPLQPARVSLAKHNGALNLWTQAKFFMSNVRLGSSFGLSLLLWTAPHWLQDGSQGFLSSDLSFHRCLPKDHCKLLNPLSQPLYLSMTDTKHLGACECPKWHNRLSWKEHLVHHQPPERFNPEYTDPGSCPSFLLTKNYLL